MSRAKLPVIAVGGGPAGAAFALELARHGVRVIVLESSRSARHVVCGEFLSEEAHLMLSGLGLDSRTLGASSVERLRLVQDKCSAVTRLPFAAATLSRYRLDEILLQAAAQAGAEVVRSARVTRIEPSVGIVTVREAERVWYAAAVALATGKHPIRAFPRPLSPMVGFKMHLQPGLQPHKLAGMVQLVFFQGGYVGACLVEDGILSVAWVMQDHVVRAVGSGWVKQSAFLARQSSLIGDLLTGAQPLMTRPIAVAAIPYGYLRREAIAPEVYPVGDQLAVVPSFTGDGIAIALYSGLAAARAWLAGQQAAPWQRELIRQLRPQFRTAAGIGRLLETPFTCRMSIAATKLLPSLARTVASATRLRGFDATLLDELRRPSATRHQSRSP
jgi:flavin-dependent dehydrogenase